MVLMLEVANCSPSDRHWLEFRPSGHSRAHLRGWRPLWNPGLLYSKLNHVLDRSIRQDFEHGHVHFALSQHPRTDLDSHDSIHS